MSEDLGPSTRPRRVVCTLCGTMGEPTTVDADAWAEQLAHENGKEHQARYGEIISIREVPWEAAGPPPAGGDVDPPAPATSPAVKAGPGSAIPPDDATPESERPRTPPAPPLFPAELRKLAIPPRLRIAAAVWIAAAVLLIGAGACARTTLTVVPGPAVTVVPVAATPAAIATPIPTPIPTATPPPVELGAPRPRVSGPAPFLELVDGALDVLLVRAPDAYGDVVRYLTEIRWEERPDAPTFVGGGTQVATGVFTAYAEAATRMLFDPVFISPYYQSIRAASLLVHEACHVEHYQDDPAAYPRIATSEGWLGTEEELACAGVGADMWNALAKAEPVDLGRTTQLRLEEVSP